MIINLDEFEVKDYRCKRRSHPRYGRFRLVITTCTSDVDRARFTKEEFLAHIRSMIEIAVLSIPPPDDEPNP